MITPPHLADAPYFYTMETIMNIDIKAEEDKLFSKWQKKYEDSGKTSFIKDGCPNPEVYVQERRKVVVVLKDGNMRKPDEGVPFADNTHDQRIELGSTPDLNTWWSTIAKWCYFLQNPSASWELAKSVIRDTSSMQAALSRHCIVQLKKEWGTGGISNDALARVVMDDKVEIVSQLAIYDPDFIIACGNGEHLSKVFACDDTSRLETSAGVGYWKLNLNGKPAYLIDYCHPSARVGTKVKGIVAKGLTSAIQEIEK